jgi:uncharacterized phiE125 gp8 family phage protein
VEIELICGYGNEAEDIPNDIMQAMRLLLAHFYENRAEETVGQVQTTRLTLGAHALLQPHVLHI